MKTADLKRLVDEALASLPTPHSEHIIDEVFHAIETHAPWRQEYERIRQDLGTAVANTWGGHWIGNKLGKCGQRQVPARKSTLIGSYSILDTDFPPRKPTEAEARELMAAYYQAHKSELTASIRAQRDRIIQLIVEGMSAHDAFALAGGFVIRHGGV
ncbi:hypothetical protein [Methylomagnum ishizawai]|uniref:hypothetical protein n=1 Tax=Methylomagnum ishizawai TaxID=1760988 RepID=UPI001C32517E|nr:hypothetical protein [Methylomagnum ishizawai]BBL75398.1 hypothetical protein MishRS11D_24960 [Methylomagnum ishizawai]